MSTEIDLLTMNLWGLPWPIARARRERKRRFAAHLESTRYDLVGIQELWWPWRRALPVRELVLPSSPRDSGLALAARLPVREARVEPFAAHRGVDSIKRKGALRAQVEAPCGAELAVCVAHLQAGGRHGAVRARQIDQLVGSLAEERGPVVLMGDFNLHADAEEDRESAQRLHEAGFEDVALSLASHEDTYTACNPYARSRTSHRFDRVYLRSSADVRLEPLDVEVVKVGQRPLSDHHPVRVRVRLGG